MKKHIKLMTGIGLLLAVASAAPADDTNIYSSSPNAVVPDGNTIGIPLTLDATTHGIITSVVVSLDITGGWNGDLYAYLAGPNGDFAVLLNRTGVNGAGSGTTAEFGYSDAGFNITLSDGAANNIHYYEDQLNPNGGQLTGNWQPDGENVDPSGSDVGTPTGFSNPATLDDFLGTDPYGTWTLYVADLSSGNESTVVNWGLTIVTVPEPQTWAYAGMGLLGLLAVRRWKRKSAIASRE